MRKRLLSLLLVLACVLTLAVVPVVAAEPDPVQPTASVTEPTPTTDPEPSPEPSSEPRLRPSLRPYRRRPARGIRRRWILPAITVSCSAIPAAT